MAKEENKDLTGLDVGTPRTKDKEYDLTAALLQAAEFRASEQAVSEIEIRKGGQYLFSLHVRPISDTESRTARKKATTYMPNPAGRKYPPIEKEMNSSKFHSLLIYTATTDEDKEKIWNNKALKDKYDILDPVDLVDIMFDVGEKMAIVDEIMDISGMNGEAEDEISPEEYAKN